MYPVSIDCIYCIYTGWWFGTFSILPYIGKNHPNWLIFFRGVETTNQYIHIYIYSTQLYDVICPSPSGLKLRMGWPWSETNYREHTMAPELECLTHKLWMTQCPRSKKWCRVSERLATVVTFINMFIIIISSSSSSSSPLSSSSSPSSSSSSSSAA